MDSLCALHLEKLEAPIPLKRSVHSRHPLKNYQKLTASFELYAAVTSKLKSLKPYLFSWWGFNHPELPQGPPKMHPTPPTCPKNPWVFPPFFGKPKRVWSGSKSSQFLNPIGPSGQGIGDPELSKSANQRFKNFWWSENKEQKEFKRKHHLQMMELNGFSTGWLSFAVDFGKNNVQLYCCTSYIEKKSATKKSGSKVAGSCGFRFQLLEPANKLLVIHSWLVNYVPLPFRCFFRWYMKCSWSSVGFGTPSQFMSKINERTNYILALVWSN